MQIDRLGRKTSSPGPFRLLTDEGRRTDSDCQLSDVCCRQDLLKQIGDRSTEKHHDPHRQIRSTTQQSVLMTSHSGYITTSTKMGLSGLHSSANMAGVNKNELARFAYDTRGNYCLHCSWRWIYTVSEDYALMLKTRKPYHVAGRTKVSLTVSQ